MAVKKGEFQKSVGQYISRGNAYYHKGCSGQLMIDAIGHRDLPIGLGFAPGDSRFRIDVARQKIVRGGCLKCRKEGIFADSRKPKHLVKHPKLGRR